MLDTPREDRRKHGRFAGRSGVAVGGQWTRWAELHNDLLTYGEAWEVEPSRRRPEQGDAAMTNHEQEHGDGDDRTDLQRLSEARRSLRGALLARIVKDANRETDREAALDADD
jgi:hypothetical protein